MAARGRPSGGPRRVRDLIGGRPALALPMRRSRRCSSAASRETRYCPLASRRPADPPGTSRPVHHREISRELRGRRRAPSRRAAHGALSVLGTTFGGDRWHTSPRPTSRPPSRDSLTSLPTTGSSRRAEQRRDSGHRSTRCGNEAAGSPSSRPLRGAARREDAPRIGEDPHPAEVARGSRRHRPPTGLSPCAHAPLMLRRDADARNRRGAR